MKFASLLIFGACIQQGVANYIANQNVALCDLSSALNIPSRVAAGRLVGWQCIGGVPDETVSSVCNKIDKPEPPWSGIICEDGFVVSIDLHASGIFGQLPTTIGFLTKLITLNLEANTLFGPIPSELGRISSLVNLQLSSNFIQGTLPTTFAELSSLKNLELQNNKITGRIPNGLGVINLEKVDISTNLLTGTMPFVCSTLKTLVISNNQFNAIIPSKIGSLKSLESFVGSSAILKGSMLFIFEAKLIF